MRPASNEELRILQRLLSISFPGIFEYRAQLDGLMVEPDGKIQAQLGFIVQDLCPAAILPKSPLIVEGRYTDTDGILVDILLFAHTSNALGKYMGYSTKIIVACSHARALRVYNHSISTL